MRYQLLMMKKELEGISDRLILLHERERSPYKKELLLSNLEVTNSLISVFDASIQSLDREASTEKKVKYVKKDPMSLH